MSGTRFTSAFAADLEGYLAFKQNMGCYGASRIWYLRQFDAWCAEHSRTVFDQGTVEGWVRARLESSGRYRSWMSYIRDFGRWLQATGHDDACVLSDRWKAPFIPPRPYLLSRQEIEQFFTAAAALPYILDIGRGRAQPRIASWSIWAVVQAIGTASASGGSCRTRGARCSTRGNGFG